VASAQAGPALAMYNTTANTSDARIKVVFSIALTVFEGVAFVQSGQEA
jgi:hypothetical protein